MKMQILGFRIGNAARIRCCSCAGFVGWLSDNLAKKVSACLVPILTAVIFSVSSVAVASESVDINSADAETIAQSLQGIGPVKAQAIVAFRNKNGLFKSIDQLKLISGIGDALLLRIKPYLVLSGTEKGELTQSQSSVTHGDPDS